MGKVSKRKRHAVIKRLINEHDINNQAQLLALLEAEMIETTQATVSRDMQELNIVKNVADCDESYYYILNAGATMNPQMNAEEKLFQTLGEIGISIKQIQFINILTVQPGNGQAIGILIDSVRAGKKEIVACLAGDDTILVLSSNEEDARKVYKYFLSSFY